MRTPLPAVKGDVLAYIGFLSLEGRVSAESLPQYVSAVSRCHELHFLPSTNQISMVRSLVKAYGRNLGASAPARDIGVGCPAAVVSSIVTAGPAAISQADLDCCAATVFSFFFQVRAVSLSKLRRQDVVFDDSGITASIYRRKGMTSRRPLLLRYPISPSWTTENPISLLYKWACSHPWMWGHLGRRFRGTYGRDGPTAFRLPSALSGPIKRHSAARLLLHLELLAYRWLQRVAWSGIPEGVDNAASRLGMRRYGTCLSGWYCCPYGPLKMVLCSPKVPFTRTSDWFGPSFSFCVQFICL